ncbi:MAG: hypothetical protein Edafosvirus1_46 [Edafosvirus sp.]|uniref:Uncharacterized protein n=1 Tax=Edafosvirus sp. TaxID=2487765 RepID=A0A3G4ZS59_9VIRU|nr:MAG: hypothetical protein Edafosvirus1_46 [Edafosvirus sp.]
MAHSGNLSEWPLPTATPKVKKPEEKKWNPEDFVTPLQIHKTAVVDCLMKFCGNPEDLLSLSAFVVQKINELEVILGAIDEEERKRTANQHIVLPQVDEHVKVTEDADADEGDDESDETCVDIKPRHAIPTKQQAIKNEEKKLPFMEGKLRAVSRTSRRIKHAREAKAEKHSAKKELIASRERVRRNTTLDQRRERSMKRSENFLFI